MASLAPPSAGPAAPAGGAVTRQEVGALAAILVVGAILRLCDLGDGLWIDEIDTLVRYVRQPLSHIVTTFESQNQHMLYSVLARLCVVVLGESAAALRLPAAIFGIVSLWAVWYFARPLVERLEALLASLLLAVSYHHVWFSQNARGYTMLLAFTLIGSRLFLELLDVTAARRVRAVLYALVMGLALYTHLTAALVIAGHGLAWLWSAWRARRTGSPVPVMAFMALAGSALAALILYAPVLPHLASTTSAATMPGVAVAWRSPLWFAREALRVLVAGLPGGWVSLLLGAVVALAGLWSWWKRSALATGVMLLPVAVTAVVLLVASHNLWPRFFFFAAGFSLLIAVRGTMDLAVRVLPALGERAAAAVLMLGALASLTTVPRAWHPKQDFAGAQRWIVEQQAAGDVIVALDVARYAYQDFLGTGWATARTAAELEAAEPAQARTWVVYTFPARLEAVQPDVWQRLQQHYRLAREFPGTVGGGSIVVMVR